jgi:hypothetical protein
MSQEAKNNLKSSGSNRLDFRLARGRYARVCTMPASFILPVVGQIAAQTARVGIDQRAYGSSEK